MNALGVAIVWCAARGTLAAAFGIGVSLLAGKRGPAAGALAALASLSLLLLLLVLAAIPWPARWSFLTATAVGPPAPTLPAGAAAAAPALRANSEPPPRRALTDVLADADPVEPTASAEPAASASSASARKASVVSPAAVPSSAIVPPRRAPAGMSIKSIPGIERIAEGLMSGAALRPAGVASRGEPWRWQAYLALGFMLGAALGLLRLAAGLVAVRACVRGSLPVREPALGEMVVSLAGALGLKRAVAVRESAEVLAPATVGWLRPVIVLPLCWRRWNELQRRVVLAHELAHIKRHDYAGWIVARLSLALHFYHPLAHWLAARLRLEQELAADAWGVCLAGDRKLYLTTLAEMALGHDAQPARGLARAFLPFRGNLMRRIEMLRMANNLTTTSPACSWSMRAFTVGVLVGAGLLLTGLRMPLDSAHAQTQNTGPKAAVSASDDTAPAAAVRDAGKPAPLDLTYVPSDAAAVVAIRPAALHAEPALRPFFERALGAHDLSEIFKKAEGAGLTVDSIDQLTYVCARMGSQTKEEVMASSALIVRTLRPFDWKRAAAAEFPASEATYAGKKYLRVLAERFVGVYMPDDRTAIIAMEPNLFRYLEGDSDAARPHRWAEPWKACAGRQAAVAVDVGWVRALIEPALLEGEAAYFLSPLTPLWEETTAVVLGVDIKDGVALDLLAVCGTKESGEPVLQTFNALLTLARNSARSLQRQFKLLASARREDESMLKELDLAQRLGEVAEQATREGRVDQQGSVVRLRLTAKFDVADALRIVLGDKQP